MKATKDQKQYIYKLCSYQTELKEECVQWATGDVSKTSTHDLTFEQANQIIRAIGGRPESANTWGFFTASNPQHKRILSILLEMGWKTRHPKTRKYVADIARLGEWLQSPKSPVKKPLCKMDSKECSKVIYALSQIAKKTY